LLHARAAKFDVMKNLKKNYNFFRSKQGLTWHNGKWGGGSRGTGTWMAVIPRPAS